MWNFCRNAQFPQSFGRITRKTAETVCFHKISTPGNHMKFWYFTQSCIHTSRKRWKDCVEEKLAYIRSTHAKFSYQVLF